MRRSLTWVSSAAAACALAIAGAVAAIADPETGLRMNQIEVIGSAYNSYHAGLTPGVAKLLKATNPKAFDGLDYSHAKLTTQLDNGTRQIELDVYADVKGGRFAHPFGATLNEGGAAGFDREGVMLKPGFKVMHVQDIDYISNCQPFVACLKEACAPGRRLTPPHVPDLHIGGDQDPAAHRRRAAYGGARSLHA